jgi:hypothetical protein
MGSGRTMESFTTEKNGWSCQSWGGKVS